MPKPQDTAGRAWRLSSSAGRAASGTFLLAHPQGPGTGEHAEKLSEDQPGGWGNPIGGLCPQSKQQRMSSDGLAAWQGGAGSGGWGPKLAGLESSATATCRPVLDGQGPQVPGGCPSLSQPTPLQGQHLLHSPGTLSQGLPSPVPLACVGVRLCTRDGGASHSWGAEPGELKGEEGEDRCLREGRGSQGAGPSLGGH